MPPASARTLTLELDEHTAALASEALRGEADRRRRAAQTVSAELTEKKRTDGTDIRGGAVQVVNTLAEADALLEAADQLTDAWAAAEAKKAARKPRAPKPSAGDDDDGDELAQRIADAELAAAARKELGVAPDVDEDDDGPGDDDLVAPAAPTLPPS